MRKKERGGGVKGRKKGIRFVCPRCDKEPDIDKERSNNNWKVIDPICKDCKLPLKIELF